MPGAYPRFTDNAFIHSGPRIQELATRLGLSGAEVQKGLASVLPQLVDKLTPNGKLPEGNEAADMLGQLAKKFLGGA